MAANGPVSLRAHTDALSILADQSVTITSVNDEIRIGANQQIQLVAGQSAITLNGGDIDFTTPGAFTVHGATHAFLGGPARQRRCRDCRRNRGRSPGQRTSNSATTPNLAKGLQGWPTPPR
jgi:uncharacterized protein (DUF2345 family)